MRSSAMLLALLLCACGPKNGAGVGTEEPSGGEGAGGGGSEDAGSNSGEPGSGEGTMDMPGGSSSAGEEVRCCGCYEYCQLDIDACIISFEEDYSACMTDCEEVVGEDAHLECENRCMDDNGDAIVECETGLVGCESQCDDVCSEEPCDEEAELECVECFEECNAMHLECFKGNQPGCDGDQSECQSECVQQLGCNEP